MISFRPVNLVSEEDILSHSPLAERGEVSELLSLVRELSDFDSHVTVCSDCLLVRIFSSGYEFAYPIALIDGAEELVALREIREYALKEEIPLIFFDTPEDRLPLLENLFRYIEITDSDSCTVSVKNELMEYQRRLGGKDICFKFGDLTLLSPAEDMKQEYFVLSTEEKTNEYWGYDYRGDNSTPDADYFMREALSEYSRGTSVSLFITHRDRGFIGEGVLYGFDMQGGCQCGIRLLKKHAGAGFGKMGLDALLLFAKELKLKEIRARVNSKNIPSKKLFEKNFSIDGEDEENIYFTKVL